MCYIQPAVVRWSRAAHNKLKGESQRDEATKARMFEIYETFNKLDYQTGIYDNTQSFVETSTTAPRKNATTAIRYVIV